MTHEDPVRTARSEGPGLLRSRYRLTAAEMRVALLVSEGLSYGEIAERLEVSSHTVHTHIKSIHRKLDVRSNGRAAALIRGLKETE